MKLDLENLKRLFKYSYDTYEPSLGKYKTILEMFNNNQYTEEEVALLREQGRPCETFNVIKLFVRIISGYYDSVSNTAIAKANNIKDVPLTSLLNGLLLNIDDKSNVRVINEKIRQEFLLSGLAVHELVVKPVKDINNNIKRDSVGRVEYEITKEHVPVEQILLDPDSVQEDYSDARFIHRWKWIDRENLIRMFGARKVNGLLPDVNSIADITVDEDANMFGDNIDEDYDKFILVRTIIKEKDNTYSIYWCNDRILRKTKITQNLVKFPYQVVKLQNNNKDYFGIVEDFYETQRTMNQALLQIQLGVNTNKVFVRKGAIDEEDWDKFVNTVTRINSIIELDDLDDIQIVNMSADIQQQYRIIEEGFRRIQRILGVNDSFLGQAFASDSGRKVKLQQNSTISSLKYLDVKFELLFRLIGIDTVNLIKQYYTANKFYRVSNNMEEDYYIEINKPLVNPETNEYMYDIEVDPSTGRLMKDKDGNFILTPLNDYRTDIGFLETDIRIISVPYNNEDEASQVMVETVLNGAIGNALLNINPANYLKVAGLVIGNMRNKNSKVISDIIKDTINEIQGQQPQPQQPQQNSPGSREFNIPGVR